MTKTSSTNFVLRTTLFFTALAACTLTHAQSTTSGIELRQKWSKSQWQAGAEIQQYSFLRADENYFGAEEKSSQITTVGASLAGKAGRWQVDGRWFYVPQEEFHYVSLPELSYTRRLSEGTWILGRHQMNWSAMDEEWGMTLWQPRMTWDRLRPETQGFTGVFFQKSLTETQQWTVFVSDLFQPDLGPRYREEDGKITSVNPWFKTPPPVIELWEKNTPVVARVTEPQAQEVVLQPTLAVQWRWQPTENYQTHLAYAYKPMNYAHLSYMYFLRARDSISEVEVEAKPDFPYHHVGTWENQLGQKNNWQLMTSLTYDSPKDIDYNPKEITQGFTSSTIGALTVRWVENPEQATGWQADLGLLNVWADRARDKGDNAQQVSQFEERLPFRRAVRLGFEKGVSKKASRFLVGRAEATYDPVQQAGFVLSELSYGVTQSWKVLARMDLIGATTAGTNDYEKSFLRAYKANDNLSLGFNYAF